MSGERSTLEQIAVDIVAAYVVNNNLPIMDLPALIESVQTTLIQLSNGQRQPEIASTLIVTEAQIRKSITPDAIISFIDGKPYKTLRRHLTVRGLTAYAYRVRYGLPANYPMVAASYSAKRADISRSHSFGKHGRL